MSLQEQINQLDNKKCLIISALVAVFYYFFFFDGGENIKSQIKIKNDNLAKKQKELSEIEISLKNKEKFELENKKIFENMKDFESHFTPDISNNVLLEKISNNAKSSDIIVNKLEPNKPREEFPDYPGKVIHVNISSQYHNLMSFISKLTQMQRVVDFEDLGLEVENKGDIPILNLKMNLIVYTIKSINEAEGPAEKDKDKDKDKG